MKLYTGPEQLNVKLKLTIDVKAKEFLKVSLTFVLTVITSNWGLNNVLMDYYKNSLVFRKHLTTKVDILLICILFFFVILLTGRLWSYISQMPYSRYLAKSFCRCTRANPTALSRLYLIVHRMGDLARNLVPFLSLT